jgi:hypothetical protein
MKKLSLLLLLCSCLFWGACTSNEFEVDIKSQTISSTTHKGIMRFCINSATTNEHYNIEWKDDNRNAPKTVNLSQIDSGYVITLGYLHKKINNAAFKLKSQSKYEIDRVQGDATSYTLFVRTNNLGLIDSVWQ